MLPKNANAKLANLDFSTENEMSTADLVEQMMVVIERVVHDERYEEDGVDMRKAAAAKFYRVLCKHKLEKDPTWWKLFDAAFDRTIKRIKHW